MRRLLVFGVCALGVTGLYLVPSPGGSPDRSATPRSEPKPQTQPVAYVRQGTTAIRTTGSSSVVDPTSERWQTGADTQEAQGPERPDRESPSAVGDLSFPSITAGGLTIRWSAATDNLGVVSYRVWLNGFRVADTSDLQVVVPWFHDGSHQQVVQVRAVDAAGNQSIDAPARLVTRPMPVPTSAPGGGTVE